MSEHTFESQAKDGTLSKFWTEDTNWEDVWAKMLASSPNVDTPSILTGAMVYGKYYGPEEPTGSWTAQKARAFLSFDTSSLSGQIITSVKLRIYLNYDAATRNISPDPALNVYQQAWGTLDEADWDGGNLVGSIKAANLTNFACNEITLDVDCINKEGETQLKLAWHNDMDGTVLDDPWTYRQEDGFGWAGEIDYWFSSGDAAENKPILVVTTSAPPPSDLLCNGQTNPSDIVPEYFSAISHEVSPASYYRIQVNKSSDFSGRMVWDSGKTVLSTSADPGERCENINYNGQTLPNNGITYYWRIKFWNAADEEGDWSTESSQFTMLSIASGSAPWDEDVVEPSGAVGVEIPRRSGNWISLNDVMRIHTSVNKNPLDALEVAQAEVLVCNISKNFNSAEAASDWYKQLEGYAIRLSVGYSEDGTPVSRKLFTGIISAVEVDRLELTAEIKVVDFLDYFGRITIEQTPVWQNISLTQLYKNLVELVFPDWVVGVDYFVENLGAITVPLIGYEKLNLLSELKNIADSRGMRLFTDSDGKLVCRSRGTEGDAWPISYDYNLISVVEKRDVNSIINWFIVHATPYELASEPSDEEDVLEPDITPPGKISGFTATPADKHISLSWSNPTDKDFDKLKIMFKTHSRPSNISDGSACYVGSGESYVHYGLTNGVKYFYAAFTRDTSGNWSEAAYASAIAGAGEEPGVDDSPPSRVKAFSATAEHSKIILTWRNPNITNFSLVRVRYSTASFPDSPTAGSSVYEGTAETTTHSNLVNGQRYYYSIFVKNTSGVWSGAEFASAIPAGVRNILQSATFEDEYHVSDPVFGNDCSSYPYSRSWNMTFSFEGKFSEDWFRFTHEWDITLIWASMYQTIAERYRGKSEDLQLGFFQTVMGVELSVQKIKVEASKVQFWYKVHYSGSAYKISFRNKLTLRG